MITSDGFLLINKPKGITSRQAVDIVKRMTTKKIGHTGTLDPMATGTLILAIGEATKFSQWIIASSKSYQATIQLGSQTDTDDATGKEIASSQQWPSKESVIRSLGTFVGKIEQVPPKFSAIHHQGRRAYKLARKEQDFELKARTITIHEIADIDYNLESHAIDCTITCQSGTYIRSIARDLGISLGCYGHLSALNRTWVAPFKGYVPCEVDDISDDKVITLEQAFSLIDHIDLNQEQIAHLAHGRLIELPGDKPLAAFYQKSFFGMIEPGRGGYYKSKKLRANPTQHI